MGFSDIRQLIDEYGVLGILSIVAIFSIVSIVKSRWFGDILSNFYTSIIKRFMRSKTKTSKPIKDATESDVLNHDIFNYVDYWTISKLPALQLSTAYRTVVFRKYLTIFLASYKKKIYNYIDCKNYQDMDQAELSTSLLNMLNIIIYDYEKEANDVGIPQIVIDKMRVKNNSNISLTIDLIEGICSSQFYESTKNLLKIYSILNIILSILESTISGSEAVCDSINGKLSGNTFEGKIEP